MAELRDCSKGDISRNILYPGLDYALPAGFGAGTAAAVNAAMASCDAAGGGIVHLPPGPILQDAPFDNKYSRVLVKGSGKSGFHDSGSPTYGTRLVANFAGTMLRHRTPFASELGGVKPARNNGGGFEYIMCDANGLATRALEVKSIWEGIYDLFALECVGTEAFLLTCGLTGTDIAEAADVQNIEKCILTFRQIAAGQNCDGVVFSGSVNANVSANKRPMIIGGQHKNGHAFRGVHCDNNKLSVNAYRVSGGTGHLVYMHGQTASLGGAYDNEFVHLSGAGPTYAEGTNDAGVIAGRRNTVRTVDKANGTPSPTKGTGASWRYEGSDFIRAGGGEIGLALGNNANQVALAMAQLGTESLFIRNGSQNHITISDGTNSWSISIDANGNLRLPRAAGTGYIEMFDKLRASCMILLDGVAAPTPPAGFAAIYVDTADGDLKVKFADGTIKTIVVDT